MNMLIKRTFVFVGTAILVLFLTGIFLPMLISTNTIPVTIILVIATTTLACGFISIYYVVKKFCIDEELRKIDKTKDEYKDHIC